MTALPKRLAMVFYAPGSLADELKEQPAWVGPLLVGGVLVVLSQLLVPRDLALEMMRLQFIEREQPVPDNMEDFLRIGRTVGLVVGPAFWFVWAFFVAGLVTVLFNFFMGDAGRYRQYLSVVAHAVIIVAVGGLLMLPLRIQTMDLQLTLGIGTFFGPFLERGFLLKTLEGIDFFSLWMYGVVATGASRIDPRRGWGSAFATLLVLGVLVAMALASFRS
jgi:hypothetical protein